MAHGTPEFDPSDLDEIIPDAHKIAIADLMLAWGRFDTMLTRFMCKIFSMGDHIGSIFIGTMDIRSKLLKIKEVGLLHGTEGFASQMQVMSDNYSNHAQVRNAIAHNYLSGVSKKEPERLIFYPYKLLKKDKTRMSVAYYHVEQIKTATLFANETAMGIMTLIQSMEGTPEAQT